MSEKRRDSKGRILRNGESQQKDGRYRYSYVDGNGKPACIYSWKLEHSDKVPSGKRDCEALRDKIKKLNKDLDDGIEPNGGELTVLQLVERYIRQKTGVKHNTEAGYKTVINKLKKHPFGAKRIDKVRLSDAKLFLISLQKEHNQSYSSVHNVRGVLRPAFQMAVDDDYLRKNPFEFQLATVLVNDSVTREAISREDERRFLKFIKEDPHYKKYYEGIYVLFKTGMRISEFVGLTLSDIDLKQRTIDINHQLQRKRDGTYVIETTKTTCGTRVLPMTDDVYECFKTIIKNRKPPSIEPIVDGYVGFLYFDKENKPMVGMHWEKYFQHALNKYNNTYKLQLPKITPHVCRHTYCSNMARSGMNPKTLQYLMGHSDIGVTLNTYTHLGLEDAQDELKRLKKSVADELGKIKKIG